MALDPALLQALREAVGGEQLLTAPGDCWPYGGDNSRRHHAPDAVVLARDTASVAAVVRACHDFTTPLTTRGRGTGTAGGAVPLAGGVVLSLERMNRILEVDPDNRLLVAQPGVLNAEIQRTAGEHGFFWPPDPTSAPFCTLGGNLGCNAAGPRAVKYGTTRENVLGLTAVTGDGSIVHSGTRTTKGVVGYDLTRLLIGSEGTLGVITEATLRLTPKPEAVRTMQAVYRDAVAAAHAVARLMAQPVVPCALELLDGHALGLIRDADGVDLPEGADALLMIEVDGPASGLDEAVAAIDAASAVDGRLRFASATDATAAARLWAVRKALSPALRRIAPKKINEDVVVPVSHIPALLDGVDRLAARHAITIVSFGHAGNGNLHVNLLIDPDDPQQMAAAAPCLDGLFDLVLQLGGTLSGEHGIGSEKRAYISRELDPQALAVMHGIKRLFDPRAILNPGKTLPDPLTR